jgi:Protein of unknown function (DUF4238)
VSQDHFVAQTYLKHFGDDTRGGMLHAYRKKDGKYFPCWPKDVCREWDGDVNRLLAHPELLGDFRRIAEPYWNASVESVLTQNISYHDKFVVATYMANLMTCTPGWRRVGVSHHNQHYRAKLNLMREAKERRGEPPDMLDEGIEMLERGELAIETDPDYIKALVTRSLMQYAWHIYNQDWAVLRNHSMQPFITSDNPVALAYSGSAGEPVRRFLPITPRLCLGIRFDPHADPAGERLTPKQLEVGLQRPPRGSIGHATCGVDLAKYINRVQVQSAEDLVFSSAPSEGINRLIGKYANYRMDVQVMQFRDSEDDAMVTGSILSVREFRE